MSDKQTEQFLQQLFKPKGGVKEMTTTRFNLLLDKFPKEVSDSELEELCGYVKEQLSVKDDLLLARAMFSALCEMERYDRRLKGGNNAKR